METQFKQLERLKNIENLEDPNRGSKWGIKMGDQKHIQNPKSRLMN